MYRISRRRPSQLVDDHNSISQGDNADMPSLEYRRIALPRPTAAGRRAPSRRVRPRGGRS